MTAQEGSKSAWHRHDWNAVLAGECVADKYLNRAGLIRKDRLSAVVPPEHHPPTKIVKSYQDLLVGLKDLTELCDLQDDSIEFVLKEAHSSNAKGIQFLTGRDARDLIRDSASVDPRGSPLLWQGWMPCVSSSCLIGALVLGGCWRQFVASSHSQRFKSTPLPSVVAWCTAAVAAAAAAAAAAAVAVAGGGGGSLSRLTTAAEVSVGRRRASPPALLRVSELLGGRCHPEFAAKVPATTSSHSGSEKKKAPARDATASASSVVWILQRHIRPWLIDGRKFHMRALLLCVGDLAAFMHEDIRILVATRKFVDASADPTCTAALVTNMGANQREDGYSDVAQNLCTDTLGDFGLDAEEIRSEASHILSLTLSRLLAAGRRQFFTLPNCWELFGVDLLVEGGTGRIVLLEVNPSPSLAMYGSGDSACLRSSLLGGRQPLEEETFEVRALPSTWRALSIPIDEQ